MGLAVVLLHEPGRARQSVLPHGVDRNLSPEELAHGAAP